jgi:VWFA-related protein
MWVLCAVGALAFLPLRSPDSAAQERRGEFTLKVDVNLVVLHASVLDKKGRQVDGLKAENFRVYEDGVQQQLSVFSQADIPVTMGIIIDDSGSMRDKRSAVNAAAVAFVKTSNPQDEVFVVNFNDVYYLDTPGDFAGNLEELKAALDKSQARGGTALYDALHASLDHLKLGTRDKKVLLVISDGEDNASRYTFEELIRYAQKSDATIHVVGLLGEEEPGGLFKIRRGSARRAQKVLDKIVEVTGGASYYPRSLDEVEATCLQIAHDIRNQYTLAYYPTNTEKDGTFRAVRVEVTDPHSKSRLNVRTRTGYYAPRLDTPAVAKGQ